MNMNMIFVVSRQHLATLVVFAAFFTLLAPLPARSYAADLAIDATDVGHYISSPQGSFFGHGYKHCDGSGTGGGLGCANRPTGGGYNVGAQSSFERRSYFVFDLASVTDTITSARFLVYSSDERFDAPNGGYWSSEETEEFQVWDVDDPGLVSSFPTGDVLEGATSFDQIKDIFDDLGDGVQFGSLTMTEAEAEIQPGVVPGESGGKIWSIALSNDAIASLNAATGEWALGASMADLPEPPGAVLGSRLLFGSSVPFWVDDPNRATPVPQLVLNFDHSSDFDMNGVVDGKDFLTWQRGFGLEDQWDNSKGDAVGNGIVGNEDLLEWQQQYGLLPPPSSASASLVPEPSIWLLAGMGLMLSCGLNGRNRQRQVTINALRRPRHGFTLVELLVVIAIIGMLVALLLPAVQAARESARRAQCVNNMKQLGLGLALYEETNKTFPHGWAYGPTSVPGIATEILNTWSRDIFPFIEQKALYEAWDHERSPSEGVNVELAATPVESFKCPSSPQPIVNDILFNLEFPQAVAVNDYATTNDTYELPDGYETNTAPGIITSLQSRGLGSEIRRVTDGLSNTLLLAEHAGHPKVYIGGPSKEWPNYNQEPNTWNGHWARRGRITFRPEGLQLYGQPISCSMNCTNFFHMQPFGFHPGGCNFGFGDGRVDFLSEDISIQLLAVLITRDDGIVPDDYL